MRFGFTAVLWAALCFPASAERIVLIYGDVLEGSVVSQTDKTITIRGSFGDRVMNKSDIREIVKDAPETVSTASPGTLPPEWAAQPPQPAQPAGASAPTASIPAGAWPSAPPAAPSFQAPSAPSTPSASSVPLPPREVPSAPVPQAQPVVPSADAPLELSDPAGAPQASPSNADALIRRNAEIQGQWKDLEISYIQRTFAGTQVFETRYIARIIPPNYLRAKLISSVPVSQQFPQGGEVEYDMYRAKGTLWQVAKVPGQPVQYLQMDASRVERQAAANPIESFQKGFAGTGTDESLLQPLARSSSIIGEETIEGHDCWVMETRYTADLIEAQVQRYPTEIRGLVRQQLGQIGLIRNWIGKQDLVQWRMESFTPAGQPLLAMLVLSIKPNANLQPDDLRMRVPKGTVWVDITDMVAGGVNQMLQGQPLQQQQLQQQAARLGVQTQPQTTYSQVPAVQPQQSYPAPAQQQPSAFQTAPQQQTYTYPGNTGGQTMGAPQQQVYAQPQQQQMWQMQQQAAQPSYQPQARQPGQFQQTYVQQGNPGAMPQQQMMMPQQQQQQMMMQQQQPQQQSGGGFLSRLFGGGRQQQPQPQGYSGYPPPGNQQMMMPVINGQPQMPYQGR